MLLKPNRLQNLHNLGTLVLIKQVEYELLRVRVNRTLWAAWSTLKVLRTFLIATLMEMLMYHHLKDQKVASCKEL